MIILVSEEYRRNFIRSVLERLPGTTPILEAASLEEFYVLAETYGPQMAIVDAQLIAANDHDFYEQSDKYISEMILINNFREFAVNSFLEFRRVHNEPPSGQMLEQVLKGIMHRTASVRPKAGLLTLKTKENPVNLLKEEVLFVEANSGKSVVHSRRGMFAVRSSLDQMEQQLGDGFLRVHRSFIVNMKEIRRVTCLHDRSYEIEFDDYPQKAIMSHYKSRLYHDLIKNRIDE